jgi:hypothetical protein
MKINGPTLKRGLDTKMKKKEEVLIGLLKIKNNIKSGRKVKVLNQVKVVAIEVQVIMDSESQLYKIGIHLTGDYITFEPMRN